jgi:cytochrome c oxidase cbb3-type subunit 3
MRLPRSSALVAVVVLSAALACACDRAPSSDGLKEWTAADHDGEKKAAAGAKQAPKGESAGPSHADVTWRSQCASCHGPGGHGDGPQGPMFKAADLSSEDWQSKATDQEIAAAIANGKGRMPKFDLPEDIVKGLVVRVRSFRGK